MELRWNLKSGVVPELEERSYCALFRRSQTAA